MKKLVSFVIGTRPEAIKMAPLIKQFNNSSSFKTRIILTGQHLEMVKQVIDLSNLKPNINFNILEKKPDLNDITTLIINELNKDFKFFKPEIIFVQGDTTSALAAALSAFHNKIPIGHVEAGLRTNDIFDPYPEEANRRLISQIATLNFAPTKMAVENLKSSSITGKVFHTGNTVVDSLFFVRANSKLNINTFLNIGEARLILVTIHRRENWGENLEKISKGLIRILKKNKNVICLVPLHKNNLVREPLKKHLGNQERVIFKEPLDYEKLVTVLNKSYPS